MGMSNQMIPPQVADQMAQRAGQQGLAGLAIRQTVPKESNTITSSTGQTAMLRRNQMPSYDPMREQQTMPYGMPPSPQGGMGGKGGQPSSPQQLGQALQQQALMQRQMPLSNQRQPQGGLAGRTAPQVQNAARAAMGSFRGY